MVNELVKHDNKTWKLRRVCVVSNGPHKGERRAKLVPLGPGNAVWVSVSELDKVGEARHDRNA